MNIGPDDFAFVSALLKERSGLILSEDKGYLIESRLLPVARGRGIKDVRELCAILRAHPDETLLVEVTEAMTTNESSFFRDIKPFEQLRQMVLPMLMEKCAGSKSLRIWSAACATGQEPYSIAMCLEEDKAKMADWHCQIIATDLAGKVLDRARSGIYSQFEAQRGLPIQMLVRYFKPLPDTSWQIKEEIRGKVQFRQHNLLADCGSLGRFDLIFCRNVMIYFDDAAKERVTKTLAAALEPHGVLVIGGTESLIDPGSQFMPLEGFRGAYRLK